jgi:hypothetical protein
MPRQPPLYRNLDKSCFTFPFDFSFGIDSAKQNPMQCRTFMSALIGSEVFQVHPDTLFMGLSPNL